MLCQDLLLGGVFGRLQDGVSAILYHGGGQVLAQLAGVVEEDVVVGFVADNADVAFLRAAAVRLALLLARLKDGNLRK